MVRSFLKLSRSGFTLIEIIMVIGLLGILTVISTQVITESLNEARFEETVKKMKEIRNALIGDPDQMQGSTRSSFGYLGDVGSLPTAGQGLAALWTNPGVPAGGFTMNTTAHFGLGWNGPYLSRGSSGVDYTKDAWGTSFVYSPAASPATLVSYGADRASGGSGLSRDITLQIPTTSQTATIYGLIQASGTAWNASAQVEMNYPNGSGGLTQSLANVVPADVGTFSFASVPIGVRSATLYIPTKAAPTTTVGPIVFTTDQSKTLLVLDTGATPTPVPTATPVSILEVPIELTDSGLTSLKASTVTFASTRTSLDTGDYDGTVTYSFEVVASNADNSNRSVLLLNSAGSTVATVSVTKKVTAFTRYQATFTPTSGSNNYRVQLPKSSNNGSVDVSEARIIITQVAPTKTRLYFPLISASSTGLNSTATAVDSGTSTSYTQGSSTRYAIYYKNAAALTNMAAGSPWTLEAVLASDTGAGTAYASLFNKNSNIQITTSEVSVNSATISLATANFSNTAAGFTDLNEMELRYKSSSGSRTASVYKAGLWIRLNTVKKGEVCYRVGRYYTNNSTQQRPEQRILLNTSNFTSPVITFETTGYYTGGSGSTISLSNGGTSDGSTTGTVIAGSSVSLPVTTKGRVKSSSFTVTSNNRFLASYAISGGSTYQDTQACAMVAFTLP